MTKDEAHLVAGWIAEFQARHVANGAESVASYEALLAGLKACALDWMRGRVASEMAAKAQEPMPRDQAKVVGW